MLIIMQVVLQDHLIVMFIHKVVFIKRSLIKNLQIKLSFNLTNGGNTRRAIQNAKIDEQIGQLTIEEMRKAMANQLVFLHDLYEVRKQLYDVELV